MDHDSRFDELWTHLRQLRQQVSGYEQQLSRNEQQLSRNEQQLARTEHDLSEERVLRRRLEERIGTYEQAGRSRVRRGLRALIQPLAWRLVAVVAVLLWTLAPDVSMAAAPPNTWNCSANVAGCSYATLSAMPTARWALAAATGPDGRIYAIGGNNSSGNLSTVEAYNPSTNTWTTEASMPTARAGLAAVAGPDGKIYAIGGATGISYQSTVEAYDPGTNTWTSVASMPTARYDLAAVTGSDGRIYAIGGYNGDYVSTVEAYDPGTNTWTTVASMPTARAVLAAVAGPDGKIYAIGGGNNSGLSNTVEAYDPGTNSWTTEASMPTVRETLAAATGPDGTIYAIGGSNGSPLDTVEAYDPNTNTWTTAPSMPTARQLLAAATGPDGAIYAIGGGNGGYLTTVEAYSPTGTGSASFGHTGLSGVGLGGPGVSGDGTYGGWFDGTTTQLHLVPGPTSGPPTTGTYQTGDVYMDSGGIVYVCTSGGTPCGAWGQLNNTGTTDARVGSFRVQQSRGRVTASWRLTERAGVAGFHLYAGPHQVDRSLIPVHAQSSYHVQARYAGHAPITLHVILTNGSELTVRPG
jgi:N-acetylneuraminic acid mutarotase